ncbi:MAG: hypothetical protein ACE363_13010 [Alphaproteobacteria bacterium]
MVHIQHGALRTFKQDTLAAAPRIRQEFQGRPGERQHLVGNVFNQRDQRIAVDLRLAEAPAQRIVMCQQGIDARFDPRPVTQVTDAQRTATHLVFIGRADATPRGADLGGVAGGVLAHGIKLTMQRQDQRRILCDVQSFRADLKPLAAQSLHLVNQRPGVNNHPVANQ